MSEQTPQAISETLADPSNPALRAIIAVLAAVLTAACIAWSLDAPSRLGVAFYTQQLLALVLGLGLGIIYFSVSWRGKPHEAGFPWFDVLLGLIAHFHRAANQSRHGRLLRRLHRSKAAASR